MSKITNVLIFKDGYYYLTTVLLHKDKDGSILSEDSLSYMMINEGMFQHYGIERNGFEFASDAYAYLASLSKKKENHITLDVSDGLQSGDYLIITGDNKLPEIGKVL